MVDADLWEGARRVSRPAPSVSLPLQECVRVPGAWMGAASVPLPAQAASLMLRARSCYLIH